MPIYEYSCAACNLKFEKIQKISESATAICPNCNNAEQVKKLISATNFRLKGSGWYETDFKSPNEVKRNLASDSDTPPATTNTPTHEVKPTNQPPEAKPTSPPPASSGDSASTKGT